MVARISNPEQKKLFDGVHSELIKLGYRGDLLKPDYTYPDWFSARSGCQPGLLTADLAAFGKLPADHKSACFAVTLAAPGHPANISGLRSFGAPFALEVTPERVNLWPVQADLSRVKPTPIGLDDLHSVFRSHAREWSPAEILRAKNIRPVGARQLTFFEFLVDLDLIPALEDHIRDNLDPLLRETFFAAVATYARTKAAAPDPGSLFRLVFRALAGKVLTDRGVPAFERFATSPEPNALLAAVNAHFGDEPRLIADAATRKVAVEMLWRGFNLKHISADVLSLILENTLVDKRVRKQVGLYGTPSSLARYMVERIGLGDVDENYRRVVEPCCGSGVFLLAAMERLTSLLKPGQHTDTERHNYLRGMLSGYDTDPLGVEVARDCLMLADFPNHNGWRLTDAVMLRASTLWSEARRKGICTAPPDAIDGDVILVAQSLHEVEKGNQVEIATSNTSDLLRLLQGLLQGASNPAILNWDDLKP